MFRIKNLFLTERLFIALGILAALFTVSFFLPWLFNAGVVLFFVLISLLIIEYAMLFAKPNMMQGRRIMAERLSNGDENDIDLYLENFYGFDIFCEVIDEIPHQFQKRDVLFSVAIPSSQTKILKYQLRPVKRGEYSFGAVNVFVSSVLKLVKRKYAFANDKLVPVYPSYIQMRHFELLAASNRLTMLGVKKIRRIGHSMEFEQIREYVAGDDYRTLNWKATARKGQWMVNSFQDERAQNVYCLIDKGRVMKMPFHNMTLLDYAINSSLVLSNIALNKSDKAGIITFSNKVNNVLIADRKQFQLQKINELLYAQKTNYLESDIEALYYTVRENITQRSLIILFTNYETLRGLKRNLRYLRKMSAHHLLLVVFFENNELKELAQKTATNIQEVYEQTIAEKFRFEKKQIVKELHNLGIASILTAPEQLTANTVNKYLEFKARGLI